MKLVQTKKKCKRFGLGKTASEVLHAIGPFNGDCIILSDSSHNVDSETITVTTIEEFEKLTLKNNSVVLIDGTMKEWSTIKDIRELSESNSISQSDLFQSSVRSVNVVHPKFDTTCSKTILQTNIRFCLSKNNTPFDKLNRKLNTMDSFSIGIFSPTIGIKAQSVEYLNENILPKDNDISTQKLIWSLGKYFFGYFTIREDDDKPDFNF